MIISLQKYEYFPNFAFLYVSMTCKNVNIHKRMSFSADFIVPLCTLTKNRYQK